MSIYENMDYFQIILFTVTCWKFQKIQQPYIKRYFYVFFSTNIVEILLKLWADSSSSSGAVKVLLQCRGLLRLIRWGTWCIDRYLWRSCHLVTPEGVNGMDPKTCVDSYDSQRSVHLHRVDKVRWSRRVCTASQKMLKIFKVNVTILPQPKHPRQYQWSNMNMTELPVARFLLISKK